MDTVRDPRLYIPLSECGFSPRTMNALKLRYHNQIVLIGDLVVLGIEDLVVRGIGAKSISEIEAVLEKMGLTVGMNVVENFLIRRPR